MNQSKIKNQKSKAAINLLCRLIAVPSLSREEDRTAAIIE